MKDQERVRITISLAKDVADAIDNTIDGIYVRNRSHAVESLLTSSLKIQKIHRAVVLAGGDAVEKRIPALKKTMLALRDQGISQFILATGYLGDKVKQEFGTGDTLGITLTYMQSDLGTAGALKSLQDELKDQSFYVIDTQRPVYVDIHKLLAFHREHQPVVTLGVTSITSLSGVYICDNSIFQYIPQGFAMLEETVFHELTKQGRLRTYPIATSI